MAVPSPIKMRVMCDSQKAKIQTYAVALGQAFNCSSDKVPPAYPCEKERLVIIVASLKGQPSDQLRRFCMELTPARAQNVLLVIDNEKEQAGIEALKNTLRDAGTNVIDDIYYVKTGLFSGAKISLDERMAIVNWAKKIIEKLKDN